MKLEYKTHEPIVASIGDILHLDDITFALVVETSKKGFKFLNITEPYRLPVVPGEIFYKQLKSIKCLGSLASARIEFLRANGNRESRPIINNATILQDEYLGSIVLNKNNEMLFIVGVSSKGYSVINMSVDTAYIHPCESLGDLFVLAKYSAYTLHLDN